MIKQVRWLSLATVEMFWTPTMLFERCTSVFVRRVVLHSFFITICLMVVGGGLFGGVPGANRVIALSLFVVPLAAVMNIYAYTIFFQAVLRGGSAVVRTIPLFGVIGAPFLALCDGLWRLEAGPILRPEVRTDHQRTALQHTGALVAGMVTMVMLMRLIGKALR